MSLFGTTNKTEEKGKKSAAEAVVKVAKNEKKASMKDLYEKDSKKPAAPSVAKEAENKEEKDSKKTGFASEKVLIKPIVTEKGSILNAENKYLFMVSDNANKIEVSKAILESYGIKPVKVNIINVEGKTKNRGRIIGKRKDWKKAIVSLPEGKTIQVYEGI